MCRLKHLAIPRAHLLDMIGEDLYHGNLFHIYVVGQVWSQTKYFSIFDRCTIIYNSFTCHIANAYTTSKISLRSQIIKLFYASILLFTITNTAWQKFWSKTFLCHFFNDSCTQLLPNPKTNLQILLFCYFVSYAFAPTCRPQADAQMFLIY